MDRALVWTVYCYLGLSVAHWWSVAHYLHGPTGRLWCGNVISDPLLCLVNKLGPLAAVCVAVLLWRRIKSRRWPLLPILVIPVFLGTSAALAFEVVWLRDYGFGLSHAVWWFPWL
jgi:hypothetical protein